MNPQAGRTIRALLLGAAIVLATGSVASADESPAPSLAATTQQAPPDGATLNVSPSVVAATVAPGDEATATLTLRAGQGLDIAIEPQGLGQAAGDGGFAFVEPDEDASPYTARPYVTVDPASFRLEEGDSRTVTVTVKLPEEAQPGTKYALLRVAGVPAEGDGNVGIGVALGVSVLVTTPEATATLDGEITGLDAGEVVPGAPVTVTGLVANTGSAHYGAAPNRVYQSAILRNEAGQALASTRETLTGNSIIPTFGRSFELSLEPDQALVPGAYTVDVEVGLEDGTVLDKATVSLGSKAGAVQGATGSPTDSSLLPAVLLGVGLALFLVGLAFVGQRVLRRRSSAA
jgi:hypothetical protein